MNDNVENGIVAINNNNNNNDDSKDPNELIRSLKLMILEKDQEIQSLRSQLDQYKSILIPYSKQSQTGRRKQRAQGISAEPQNLRTIQELTQQKFTLYPKSTR